MRSCNVQMYRLCKREIYLDCCLIKIRNFYTETITILILSVRMAKSRHAWRARVIQVQQESTYFQLQYAEKEYSEILYYLADGTMLDGYGTILFMNEQMKCVQEIGRIVIRDSMGNVRKEIDMIPGSKGQKADASLLARGFLNS